VNTIGTGGEHERRERGRGVLHRVGAVHHDDAVGAGGDLLADGLGELLPDRRLHVLGEDVGDDAPAVVRAPGQIGDGSQHVLGVELGGDRAGPVVDGGGDGAAGRDERDRRQVAVEGDLGGLATAPASAPSSTSRAPDSSTSTSASSRSIPTLYPRRA